MEIEDLISGHAGETADGPTFEDLVNVGYGEDGAQEILEKYPEDAQRLYDVMAASNEVEAQCKALIDENEALLHSNSANNFFDADINYSSTYTGDGDAQTIDEAGDSSATSGKEPSFGSCDCRSECKFNTGYGYKYANYGYSG